MATKGLFKGGEIPGVTERASERSVSKEVFERTISDFQRGKFFFQHRDSV